MNIKEKRWFKSLQSKQEVAIAQLEAEISEGKEQLTTLNDRLDEAEEINTVLVDENNARIAAHANSVELLMTKISEFRFQQKANMALIVVLFVAVGYLSVR